MTCTGTSTASKPVYPHLWLSSSSQQLSGEFIVRSI